MLPSAWAIASAAMTPSWLALCASHGRRGDVADRPDAGHVGAAHRVGLDEAAVRRHAELLEPDVLGVGDDADGDDGVAEALLGDLAVLGLDLARRRPCASALSALDAGAGEDRHALLGRALLSSEGGDVGILDRHDPVEHLDHRHLGAHVVVEAGELDPDRARADDQQLARHLLRHHRVAVGPDALAVGLGERQVAGAGAGRDDDVLGGELGRLAVLGGDRRACPAR